MSVILKIDANLELRLLEHHHAEALYAVVARDRDYLRRWQNWPDSIHSLNDMHTLIDRLLEKRQDNDGTDFVIFYQGQAVGKVGLVYVDWSHRRSEIGYWLAQPAQGHGLMTHACRALLDYAFEEMGLETIRIRCAAGNTRSSAIPQRLQFTSEGVLPFKPWLRGRQIEEVAYFMTADQWVKVRG